MTSPISYRPRHARAEATSTEAPTAAPIDVPTQRIAIVTPATPGMVVPAPLPGQYRHGTWAQGAAPLPSALYGGLPIPPAGLAPGHPPIRRSVTMPVIVAVMLAFAVIALIVLVSLIDNAAGGSGDGTDSTGLGSPTSSSPSPSFSGSTADRIGAWVNGGGMSRTMAISDDLDAITAAAGDYDTSALNSACRSLDRDVDSARAYGPIPDSEAQAAWSSALTHGANAATYCIAGTGSIDGDMIERSASELGEMDDDLGDVADRMEAITGS